MSDTPRRDKPPGAATPRRGGTTEEADAPAASHPSGAPEAGGATTHGSVFGGIGLAAHVLRAVARLARAVEASAYRRLRDMDLTAGQPMGARGRPNRVRQAGRLTPRERPT